MGAGQEKQLSTHGLAQGKLPCVHSPVSKMKSFPTVMYTQSSLHVTAQLVIILL